MAEAAASLVDVDLRLSYESAAARLVEDFYLPCLRCAIRYDRAVGYFRSSIYALVGVGLSDFVLAGGQMRLVCSPHLHPDDLAALEQGLDMRERLDAAIARDIEEILRNPHNHSVVRLLATLIASGSLDVKLAYPRHRNGLFHDKLGLFHDADGNTVTFRGSANETLSAWDPAANHESFEAFRSWSGDVDEERVERHRRYFEDLWYGRLTNLIVTGLGETPRSVLAEHAYPEGPAEAVRNVRQLVEDLMPGQLVPKLVTLQEHQIAVVNNWFDEGRRGIVDHVTGAGKTISALEICRRWMLECGPVLVFVPTVLLAKQWISEASHFLHDVDVAVLRAWGGADRWQDSLRDFTSGWGDFGPRLTVATLATGSSDTFLQRVEGGNHLLVIADEVHRVGSVVYQKVLGIAAGGHLGLSATPERFGDPAGTAAIFQYFGEILEPPFTMADGISSGRLVPYDYHIHLVELNEHEWEQWQALSKRIGREIGRNRKVANASGAVGDRLRHLLIQRARLRKQAANKAAVAAEIIRKQFREDDRWLVYCDSQSQLSSVIARLGDVGMCTSEYHSAMVGAPEETLDHFQRQGGILAAIRCLDEGIDIPAIDHALILASSVNRREFIQRRGRVLRTSKDTVKVSATIHDVLVAAPGGIASEVVLRSELDRAAEFSQNARNTAVRMRLARLRAVADVDMPEDIESVVAEREEAANDG